jgi:hypothetical protein
LKFALSTVPGVASGVNVPWTTQVLPAVTVVQDSVGAKSAALVPVEVTPVTVSVTVETWMQVELIPSLRGKDREAIARTAYIWRKRMKKSKT